MPTALPETVATHPLRVHFWIPQAWPSAAIHVDRVLPELRALADARKWPWQITAGAALPETAVDWLLCLKAVPPVGKCAAARTALLLNDDADRFWGRLGRFDHVVVVSSPVLASLVATVHPRVWFVEETETAGTLAQGARALAASPPSRRAPRLLWHGMRGSLDGLLPLRPLLAGFVRETGAELVLVTNRPPRGYRWGALPVRWVAWSPEALAAEAAAARLGLVPARATHADSYLKSAGRLRCLFALGCPAIGDARSPDVAAFSRDCGLPVAQTPAEWLAALHELWRQPDRLDRIAQLGHALVRERFGVSRTAAQWLWFLAGGARSGC